MKALYFESLGTPPEILQYGEAQVLPPGEGQVQVAVAFSPIQPADYLFFAGKYRYTPKFPQTAGFEAAGKVTAVGANVPATWIGKTVAFRYPGAWAQFANTPVDGLIESVPGIRLEDLSQIGLNPVTAYALLEQSGAKRGDVVLVNAATSLVARLLAGFGEARALKTLLLVRKGERSLVEDLESASTSIIEDTEEGWARLRTIAKPTGGIDCCLDSIGGADLEKSLPELKAGGTFLSYGLLSPDPVRLHNSTMVFKNLTWKGFGVDYWLSQKTAEQKKGLFRELQQNVLDGNLKLPVRAVFPPADYAKAFQSVATKGRAGKVLFQF